MKNQRMAEAENIRKELQKIPHLVYRELMLLLADDVKEAIEKEKAISRIMAHCK